MSKIADDLAQLAERLGTPGWRYMTLHRFSPYAWRTLESAIGVSNYVKVSWEERIWPNGDQTVHGSMFVSPEGMANYAKERERIIAANEGKNAKEGAANPAGHNA